MAAPAATRTVPTLRSVVDRLAAIGTTAHWVVSCYLKLEPRDRSRGKYLIKLKNRIKERLAELEARRVSRDEGQVVARDLERIREYLEVPEHLPAGRGIAIFACEPLELFDVVPLPRVFRSRLVIDHSPLVRELAAVNDEFGRVLCVVYDRTSARFFEVTAQQAVELEDLAAPGAARTSSFHASAGSERNRQGRGHASPSPLGAAGPSVHGEHNFNMRIREEKQRHYQAVAQRLFELTRDNRVDGVVLGGTGNDVDAVTPHLHPYVRDDLVGTVRLNPKSVTPAQVMEAVIEARRAREREWEARHVRELVEGLGTGWAVNGLGPTLEALARGQVRTLLVDAPASATGFRCADTGRLVLTAAACEAEGEPVPVADLIDDAMEDALRQGAHIDVVEDEGARRQVQQLAALLRFTLG